MQLIDQAVVTLPRSFRLLLRQRPFWITIWIISQMCSNTFEVVELLMHDMGLKVKLQCKRSFIKDTKHAESN